MSLTPHFPSEKELEAIANDLFKGTGALTEPVGDHLASPQPRTFSGVGDADRHDFNIDNPQTSLKDPFLSDGPAPQAVAGDGSSPGFVQQLPPELPYIQQGNSPAANRQSADGYPTAHTGAFPLNSTLAGNPLTSPSSSVTDLPFVGETIDLFNHVIPHLGGASPASGSPFLAELNRSNGVDNNTFHAHDFDVHRIRQDFPILGEYVNGRQIVWFDNAATTQKPQAVIDRISYFYQHENSNIHRAAHALAARATDAYELARTTVKDFINASSTNEIVFTRGTTESINLIAQSWGEQHLGKGDEIIISHLEHHANIVPWQLLSQKKGFTIRVIPVNADGELLLDEYVKLLNSHTKLVSFTHVSNALGTITPAKTIIDLAHQAGAKVLLDGAQSISHIPVDVQALNPDFFVFSGHKIFGPTGIGVVYGKEELLNATQPYQGGGNMIQDVTFEKTVFQSAPNRFEAGTGNIADAVGLSAALNYVQQIGIQKIAQYEHALLDYATQQLKQIPGITLIGTAREKTSVLSFTLQGYSNEQVGQQLNQQGIAVRTGHHCAQPILRRLGYESSVRPSFAFYNTFEEIDLFAHTIATLARRNRTW